MRLEICIVFSEEEIRKVLSHTSIIIYKEIKIKGHVFHNTKIERSKEGSEGERFRTHIWCSERTIIHGRSLIETAPIKGENFPPI